MTQIQTAPTTLTSLTVEDTGFNIRENRWKIRYYLTRTEILTGVVSRDPVQPSTFRTVVIQDTPATPIFDEEGVQTGTTPAGTAYTDWKATWNTHEEMLAASEAAAIAHANIQEWDGTIIDDIENDPNAATPVLWSDVIGQLIAPPNQVIFEDFIYSVVQAHTAAAQWPPNIVPALFALVGPVDGGGGNELPAWQPWPGSGPTYAVGDQVSHNGNCWESATPNNTFEPGAAGIGDNIWFQITCP